MTEASSILERVIDPTRGGFSPELARHILDLDFPPADHKRYEELSAKAQQGTLTATEEAELDEYLDVNDLLTIMKAKAYISLKHHNPAA